MKIVTTMSLVAKLLKIYYASVKAFSKGIQNAVTFLSALLPTMILNKSLTNGAILMSIEYFRNINSQLYMKVVKTLSSKQSVVHLYKTVLQMRGL